MTEQKVNYTDAMVARLHAGYDGEASDEVRREQVAELAVELGRNEASIRAKLVREGVYVAYAKVEKAGATVRKAALVQAIADEIDVDVDVVGSLEKATKVALGKVLIALRS